MNTCRDFKYNCPVEATLDLIGGKWKSVILWHLSRQTLRFSQLQRILPKVTQKMLTQQLRDLEKDGLVKRKIYEQIPPKVEYSLTDLGKTLTPLLEAICAWGDNYLASYITKEA